MSIPGRNVVSVTVGLLLAGCDFVDRGMKPQEVCFSNLRQIDSAEQSWAVENHKTTNDAPTWSDLDNYLRRTNIVCPAGGTYSLGRIGDVPACSIPEHAARYRKVYGPEASPGR